MESRTINEIRDVLVSISFKMNAGKGARVCYPNEVLSKLFGKEILDKNWIPDD